MSKEELKEEIFKYLNQFNKLGINTYQNDEDYMNFLNPYFGYPKTATSRTKILQSFGVQSVWMSVLGKNIMVSHKPTRAVGKEINVYIKDFSYRQMEGVHALMRKLVDDKLKQIEKWKANPKLEDSLGWIQSWMKRCESALKEINKDYHLKMAYGNTQVDGKYHYYAIIIEEKDEQIGSIPLKQTDNGKLTYYVQSPYFGVLCEEEEWNMESMDVELTNAIKRIVKSDINLPEKGKITNAYLYKSPNGKVFIGCEIDYNTLSRKMLSERDLKEYNDYFKTKHQYWEVEKFKYSLANKYFKDEIGVMKEGKIDYNRGMKR